MCELSIAPALIPDQYRLLLAPIGQKPAGKSEVVIKVFADKLAPGIDGRKDEKRLFQINPSINH